MVSDYETIQMQIAAIDREEETLTADYSEIQKRLEDLKKEKQRTN